MQKGKFNIVMGGQAGSESKGKLSGWLCDRETPDLLVMTSSPNAGHTMIVPTGEKKVSYHLPVGSVMCGCPIVLGPASLINIRTFKDEVVALGIDPHRITIDPRASVITPEHMDRESLIGMSDIGSTLQGVGECRTSKMGRKESHLLIGQVDYRALPDGVSILPTAPIISEFLDQGLTVLCESTQGFDLDLEHGIDPRYCTSKMINPAMAMAEAGVPPSRIGDVYGVIRPYPIRVNNRTGTSGPYAEAEEIMWGMVADRCGFPGKSAEFGEYTTTTKLPRRVFEFSWVRFAEFVRICGPTHLCLQFANYLDWNVLGETRYLDCPMGVLDFIWELEKRSGVWVSHIGTGPGHLDMISR